MPLRVVDDLGVDVLGRAVDRQAQTAIGDRLDLADVVIADRIGGASVATVEDRLAGFLGEGANDLIEDGLPRLMPWAWNAAYFQSSRRSIGAPVPVRNQPSMASCKAAQ